MKLLFHLKSVIVALLASGGFLFLVFFRNGSFVYDYTQVFCSNERGGTTTRFELNIYWEVEWGALFPYLKNSKKVHSELLREGQDPEEYLGEHWNDLLKKYETRKTFDFSGEFSWWGVFLNVAALVMIFSGTLLCCENARTVLKQMGIKSRRPDPVPPPDAPGSDPKTPSSGSRE